jgi:hypothetical protein
VAELTNMLGFDWKLLLPLVAVQFILMIIGLIDLIRIEANRVRGAKWAWAFAIVLIQMIGPVAYFVAGRKSV